MDSNRAGRVGLVTGGGRGIGRGICLELARLGLNLVVNYRTDQSAAEQTCRDSLELGAPRALAIEADISDLAQGRRLVEQTLAAMGGLDLLVNNAGVAPDVRRDVLETTPGSWDHVLGVNLRGVFFLTQAAASAMVELRARGLSSDPQIVFITSISSTFASVSRAEYCIAKAGLSMAAQVFAARLAGEGVAVHEVRPGLIETDMTRPVKEAYDARIAAGLVPMGRWGTPRDVGRAVAAIASGHLAYATGSVLEIDGGLHLRTL